MARVRHRPPLRTMPKPCADYMDILRAWLVNKCSRDSFGGWEGPPPPSCAPADAKKSMISLTEVRARLHEATGTIMLDVRAKNIGKQEAYVKLSAYLQPNFKKQAATFDFLLRPCEERLVETEVKIPTSLQKSPVR